MVGVDEQIKRDLLAAAPEIVGGTVARNAKEPGPGGLPALQIVEVQQRPLEDQRSQILGHIRHAYAETQEGQHTWIVSLVEFVEGEFCLLFRRATDDLRARFPRHTHLIRLYCVCGQRPYRGDSRSPRVHVCHSACKSSFTERDART